VVRLRKTGELGASSLTLASPTTEHKSDATTPSSPPCASSTASQSARSSTFGFALVAAALLVAVAVGWLSLLSVSTTVRNGFQQAEQVSASTEETAATAHELSTTAQGLSETAAELDRLVRRFTLAHD
jgi:uncharacterized protein HemX